jgi:hypothetical protein
VRWTPSTPGLDVAGSPAPTDDSGRASRVMGASRVGNPTSCRYTLMPRRSGLRAPGSRRFWNFAGVWPPRRTPGRTMPVRGESYGVRVDIPWAQERLETYLSLCKEISARQSANGHNWDDVCRELNDQATEAIATVSKVVKLLDSSWVGPLMPPSYTSHDGERIVRQALGALRDHAEWVTRLAPESPSLQADQMHPVVWQAACTVWETGEYKVAIQLAAVSLSAHIKARTASSLNERKLMQQVFASDSPRSGQARLHFPGDASDENWQSRQQGLHLLAQGAFAGIRNIAVHDEAAWSEHEALEHLAVLSVVAHWADDTELVSPI